MANERRARFITNTEMPQRIACIARKDGLNIKGLSIKTACKICDRYNIESPFDIFKLSYYDILKLEGFAEISASKLYDNIQDARSLPLENFIACCALDVGRDVRGKLVARFQNYHDLMVACDQQCDPLEFSSIGISTKTANFFISQEFTAAMKELFLYVHPLDYQPVVTQGTV